MKFFNTKHIEAMLAVAVFMIVLGIAVNVSAAVIDYTPLVRLPGAETASDVGDLPKYLTALFKIALGGAAALAVIMITLGGIEYMSTDSMFGKEAGKERIKQALSGLFLAIAAWLILYTVNPKTLEFKFNPTSPVVTPPNIIKGAIVKVRDCVGPGLVEISSTIIKRYEYTEGDSNSFVPAYRACRADTPTDTPDFITATTNCPVESEKELVSCVDEKTVR